MGKRWDARIFIVCGWVDIAAAVVALMKGNPWQALVATAVAVVCFHWAARADREHRAEAG